MYLPNYSEVKDLALIKAFIENHSFGAFITATAEGINVNHYPFLLEQKGTEWILYTHLARSNPQWKSLSASSPMVTAVFTGPHTYVSPIYYKDPLNVPTWNYTAVHASGPCEVVNDDALSRDLMKRLVEFYETKYQTHWKYELPESFHEGLLKGIVWVKNPRDIFRSQIQTQPKPQS